MLANIILALGPAHCLLPARGYLYQTSGVVRLVRTVVYLQVEKAGVESGTQGQNLDSLCALRRKMSVEILQELPEGEDSREVACNTHFTFSTVLDLGQGAVSRQQTMEQECNFR